MTANQLSTAGVQVNWKHPEMQPPFYIVIYTPVAIGHTEFQHTLPVIDTNSVTIRDGFDDDTYIVTVVAVFWLSYGVSDPVKITMCRVRLFVCMGVMHVNINTSTLCQVTAYL